VKVAPKLGDGQNTETNLYWGAAYGVRTYLAHAGWTVRTREKAPAPGVLERVTFTRTIARRGRQVPIVLVAEAWDGKEIRPAIERFLAMAAGAGDDVPHAVAFVGHDGLMDFALTSAPAASRGAPARASIVLACASKPYFEGHLTKGGSHPLLLTTGLMAPEAYVLDAALRAWASGEAAERVRESAAQAYDHFQKCGIKAARRLFSGSP